MGNGNQPDQESNHLISALLTPTIPVGFPRETPLHVVFNSSDRWIFSRAAQIDWS
jgi:hypothetical protein